MSPSERASEPISIESLMQQALRVPGMLSLAAGFTDNAMVPRKAVADVVRDLLAAPERGGEVLQYGDPQGRAALREAVAERTRRLDRELESDPGPIASDHVIVTNGSQQGLDLVVRATCGPGDAVLVESPTYFVFLDLLRELGVEAIPLPARSDRLDPDALPAFFRSLRERGVADRIRMAYVMGYFANPTGYCHTDAQKEGLVGALRGAGLEIPVVEDAAYREFHFREPWPSRSLLTMEDDDLPIVYGGTFTKSFATGLKIGYLVVRNEGLRRRIQGLKRVADFGTSNFTQAVIARAVEEGLYDRFLERMRPFYAEKARILSDALVDAGLRDLGWTWEEPAGGLFLWVRSPDGVEVGPDSPFHEACLEEKVLYVPGGLCQVGGGEGTLRLSFGNLDGTQLGEAAERLVRAARSTEPAPAK